MRWTFVVLLVSPCSVGVVWQKQGRRLTFRVGYSKIKLEVQGSMENCVEI